jgi:hypothetical protein
MLILFFQIMEGILCYGLKLPKRVITEKTQQREVLKKIHIEEGTGDVMCGNLTFKCRSARFRALEGKVVGAKVHVFVHSGI